MLARGIAALLPLLSESLSLSVGSQEAPNGARQHRSGLGTAVGTALS